MIKLRKIKKKPILRKGILSVKYNNGQCVVDMIVEETEKVANKSMIKVLAVSSVNSGGYSLVNTAKSTYNNALIDSSEIIFETRDDKVKKILKP